MLVSELRGDAATRGAVEKTNLHQEWFVDFFDGFRLLSQCGGERVHAHRSALVLFNDGQEQPPVDFIESVVIDFHHAQSCLSRGGINLAGPAYLGIVADATEQTVRDARRSAG